VTACNVANVLAHRESSTDGGTTSFGYLEILWKYRWVDGSIRRFAGLRLEGGGRGANEDVAYAKLGTKLHLG
jgi:hypothetical protein